MTRSNKHTLLVSAIVAIAPTLLTLTCSAQAQSDDGNSRSSAPSAIEEITILGTGMAGYQSDSAKISILGNKSLQDTPYSIEVYTRELMDNLQARSLTDATKLDASVSLSSGDLVSENNTLSIRGISGPAQKLDGMTLRSRASDLPLEHIESIDVLRGASGFLYGFGAPGGIINYTLKRPTEALTRTVNAQVMDTGLALLHGDLGDRVGTNDQFGYRLNALHESGDTYINDGESERNSASVALDWRITPDLVWRVDALEASHERQGGQWAVIPNADGETSNFTPAEPLEPIDGSKRLAPSWTSYESVHSIWGTDLNWQFSENWNLELAHRQTESYRLFYLPALFANTAGDYSAYLYNYNNLFDSEQSQAQITGQVTTGPIRHELVFGTTYTETSSSNSGPLNQFVDLGSGNLSDPEEFTQPSGRLPKSAARTQEYARVKQTEWFVSDTLSIEEDWDLIVGARHGTLDDEYGDYKESAVTPTLAIVHRPLERVSLYASYIEAFEQGATAPETALNAGEVFEPLVSEQKEVGVKINADAWSLNAALFQLQRGLTYTTPDNVFTQDGEARYEGVELSGKARLGDQWFVSASAIWLDARNERTSNTALEGKRIQGVVREQIKLYGEYRFLDIPLTLSAGAQYLGARPVDPMGQWQLDSTTLIDLGARYPMTVAKQALTLRLNIENVTGNDYWLSSPGSASLEQGAPRTIKLGVELDF